MATRLFVFGLFIFIGSSTAFPTNYRRVDDFEMAQAQEFLRTYNYLPKYPDGSLEEAVRNFQRFIHTQPSGQVDGETMDWFGKARCGMPDMEEVQGHRWKRYLLQGSFWNRTSLTYKIQVYSGDLPEVVQERIFAKAFGMWSAVSPLKFTSLSGTSLKADINIVFTEGYHGDSQPFDGPGKILGHAYFPSSGGDQHYDRAETWTDQQRFGRNLLQCVTHEIGHSLGIRHSNVSNAVMFPFISSYNPYFRLHEDDIFAIRALYGDICGTNRPCLNGGTCLNEGIVSTCKCTPGFSGKQCEMIADPCNSNPCLQGGVCLANDKQFHCACFPGFTGPLCESKIDHCRSRPCQNGGVCEGSSLTYLCQCQSGFTGTNCEFKPWHICNIRPCYNGGSCHPVDSYYECDCLAGFSGSHCEYFTTTQQTTTSIATRGLPHPYSICNIPPVDAVTTSTDGTTYFFKGDYVFALDNLRLKPGYPQLIHDEFPYAAPGPVSAALHWDSTGETWLFQGDEIFIHYSKNFLRKTSFSPTFPGIPFPIDAAFYLPYDGAAYLIKGSKYWKVDLWSLAVIDRERNLSEWGFNFHVDAFVLYSNHLYAFNNDNYYRINLTNRTIDEGYPKNTASRWFHC